MFLLPVWLLLVFSPCGFSPSPLAPRSRKRATTSLTAPSLTEAVGSALARVCRRAAVAARSALARARRRTTAAARSALAGACRRAAAAARSVLARACRHTAATVHSAIRGSIATGELNFTSTETIDLPPPSPNECVNLDNPSEVSVNPFFANLDGQRESNNTINLDEEELRNSSCSGHKGASYGKKESKIKLPEFYRST
ncbi:hypothetical protein GUJ93_ZPchr0002g26303 [Zizania palustris]|uniref:Uncharacterized protein n=1 Tax=Zizania palustris TaxID=103762 RepID=A0A8J5S6Q4_ZIZPA|nr:hypothetical protein GUJ93_ZPchr0002g26303 [Zizania palustris]